MYKALLAALLTSILAAIGWHLGLLATGNFQRATIWAVSGGLGGLGMTGAFQGQQGQGGGTGKPALPGTSWMP